MTTAQQRHGLSERQACRLFGQWRGTQRYRPTHRDDEGPLTQAIVALASQYGRYGYRRDFRFAFPEQADATPVSRLQAVFLIADAPAP